MGGDLVQRAPRWSAGNAAVIEDLRDESGFGNGGDDPQVTPAAWAVTQIDVEDSTKAMHPSQGCGGFGCWVVVVGW